MVGGGAAVEAHDVDLRHGAGALIQVSAQDSVAADAVIAHGEGGNQKCLRALFLQMPGCLGHAVVGAQGLQQEMANAGIQHHVDGAAIAFPRCEHAALRRRAQIAEHQRVIRRGSLQRHPAAGARQHLSGTRPALGIVLADAIGVGFECLRPGLQIGPVDGEDFLRVIQVRRVAAHLLPAGETIIIGSHGAVEDQTAAALQEFTNVHMVASFLLYSDSNDRVLPRRVSRLGCRERKSNHFAAHTSFGRAKYRSRRKDFFFRKSHL